MTFRKAFWKKFRVVQAAGGLVVNQKSELLLIFRRGKWDLPKGKLDPGETLEQCAIREVQEETGLQQIELKQALLTTYHTYHESGKFILKETYWYEMHSGGNQNLVPQTTEDIQEVEWASTQKTETALENSYASIVELIRNWQELRQHPVSK